jgi:LmbE family N-acetylglucosaminyl deacetylase
MDAVYPAAGSPVFFPELLIEDHLPHMPREVWCSLTMQPNVAIDVTGTWHIKLEALLHHKTQIGDIETFRERMISRRTEDSTEESPRYEERFRVVRYRS